MMALTQREREREKEVERKREKKNANYLRRRQPRTNCIDGEY